jgi:diguanylate cyclase (GGDEF)-like protein/PAS domain S-box-containing protein
VAPRREPDAVPSDRRRLEAAEALAQVGTCELSGRRLTACSPRFLQVHGFSPEACPATIDDVLARIHSDDLLATQEAIDRALSSGTAYDVRYRVIRPDGTRRIVRGQGTAVIEAGSDPLVFAAAQDITERELAIEQLVTTELRYSAIVEHANDGIWILNREGRTTFVNLRLTEMLGCPALDILGRTPASFAEGRHPDLISERRTHFECRYRRRDGRSLWTVNSRSELPESHGGGIVMIVTDISERKQMEERLRRAAESDRLTGLTNRGRFEELLDQILERRPAPDKPLALMFLNLDHFKHVNDAFGHGVGDGLLREVAERLAELVRGSDMLARFSGDEFAILLPAAGREDAAAVAGRFLTAIRDRRWQTLSRITASIGLAVAEPGAPVTRSELVTAASAALRTAKSRGRDRVELFSGDGPSGAFHWIDEIRDALEEDRLILHAQAIVPTTGQGDRRHELLLRMRSREGQVIPPGSFIPAAEEFGMMPELDRWVVSKALALARTGMAIEVNLSGASLGDRAIREKVEAAIASGVRPELLTFEVTETAAARNIEDARSFAEELKRLGCAFALDDFGTGFASLVYLKNLPVSQLKIDIEFVRDLVHNTGDQRLVRAIVQMADPLGLETVAEGIEDEATFQLLRELGVGFGQGFWIERPSPLDLATLARA